MPELRIIPLGGLGEVGKNMMAVEYGRDILIIDAGLMFPESDMYGVDYIIPDFSYLHDKGDRVRAIIITHGHEDHIGALHFVLREFNVPIYATRLTRGLIEVKLRRYHLVDETTLHTYKPGDVLDIGPFTVEPFHVCHSIPDTVGLGITTPAGLIVHSGDFNSAPHLRICIRTAAPVPCPPEDWQKGREIPGGHSVDLTRHFTRPDVCHQSWHVDGIHGAFDTEGWAGRGTECLQGPSAFLYLGTVIEPANEDPYIVTKYLLHPRSSWIWAGVENCQELSPDLRHLFFNSDWTCVVGRPQLFVARGFSFPWYGVLRYD